MITTYLFTSIFGISLLLAVADGAIPLSFGQVPPSFTGREQQLTRVNVTDNTSIIFNVLDFGAINNGTGENAFVFQEAFNKAQSVNGIVRIPPGQYAFRTSAGLTVPKGVTIMGDNGHVDSRQFNPAATVGSVLMVYGGKGIDQGCFLQLNEDSILTGLSIYYPGQKYDQTPSPYPWTVCMSGNHPVVTDLECVNCWNAIQAVGSIRHYIARVIGQPINTGIYVDNIQDVGTIENVYFKPWYSNNGNFMKWQLKYGRAFAFGRTDWEYVSNTFCSGYGVGYHFMQGSNGQANGHFIGLTADQATNASVLVDSADVYGLLFTNGQFTVNSPSSSHVIISSKNKGNVQFSNCAFWGSPNHIAKINGSGLTSFSQCVFNAWDHDKKGEAAIQVDNTATGSLIVQGSHFQMDSVGSQVDFGSSRNLTKAVIIGNVIQGFTKLTGKAKNAQIGMNADDNDTNF